MNRSFFALSLFLLLITSCSGGGSTGLSNNPVTPQNTNITVNGSSTFLWGMWDISMDSGSGELVAVPSRTAEMTLNITKFIDGPPPNLTLNLVNIDPQAGYTDLTVDVGIIHPFEDPRLSGFDVMGIFMGRGTSVYPGAGSFAIAGNNDQQLLNPDGFTRWFNAPEFANAGKTAPMFGYTPSAVATSGFTPTAVINPYKYFADGLAAGTSAYNHLSSYTFSRGIFRNGSVNHRNYDLRFPNSTGIKFQFQVVARWEQNTNYPDPPLTPKDFPIEANAKEAVAMGVEDNSTLFRLNDGSSGGNMLLSLSPIDWYAPLGAGGAMEQYVIKLYSPLWSGAKQPNMTPVLSKNNYHTFNFQFAPTSVPSNDPIPVWIEVVYPSYNYSNPAGVPNGASGPLTSYFKTLVFVADFVPSAETFIEVLTPTDGEILEQGQEYEIKWDSENIFSNVRIEYSKDDFNSDVITIVSSTPDDGSYIWNYVPGDQTNSLKVRVSSVADPEIFGISHGYAKIIKKVGGWSVKNTFIPPVQPNQLTERVDIAVYSEGSNESRAQFLDAADDNNFIIYNDDYSEVIKTWRFKETQVMTNQNVHFEKLKKFDTFLNGEYIAISNDDDHQATAPRCIDPMHGILSANNNTTGKFGMNDWNIEDLILFGDLSHGQGNDPDAYPWRYISDFCSGVTGGYDNDSRIYFLFPMSPLETEFTGWVGLGLLDMPTGHYGANWWNVHSGTGWVGNGLVDDSNARIMALAADDDTGIQIENNPNLVTFWVLDSAGRVQGHILCINMDADKVVYVSDKLDSDEFGVSVPVDLVMVPSKAKDHDISGFNWIAALLDNKNGTWSVGVWEYNYLYSPNGISDGVFHLIDITAPKQGVPQAFDVDCTDFEIHVLYKNTDEEYAVDVFSYTP